MNQPSAHVNFNSLCKRMTEKPLSITLSTNDLVRICPLAMNVYPGIVKIEEAEFFITLTPEESLWTHFKNVVREDLLNSPRLVTSVSWEAYVDLSTLLVEPAAATTIEQIGHDRALAKTINMKVFQGRTIVTLKPRVGAFAIPLFAVEGHENAYLTDIMTTPIPLRHNYTMIVSVAGLNLPETEREWFRVELRDWNQIRVTPDTVGRRLLRKARFWS